MEEVVGIVCARAGSKRLKDKNIRKIGSETLTARACRTLSQSGIKEVYCVTDIAEEDLRLGQGISILSRPEELSIDSVPLQETVLHALKDHKLNERFKYVVVLMPNAPFIHPPALKQAIAMLKNKKMKIVRTYNFEGEENGLIVADMEYYVKHNIDTYSGAIPMFGFEIHDIADHLRAVEILVS